MAQRPLFKFILPSFFADQTVIILLNNFIGSLYINLQSAQDKKKTPISLFRVGHSLPGPPLKL